MSLLTCTKCGERKELTKFYVDSRSSKGSRRQPCKACRSIIANSWQKEKAKENNFGYRVRVMATKLLQRVNNEDDNYYRRNGIKCYLGNTIQEVSKTIVEHFENDIKGLLAENIVPSIDRINPKGHYEIGNVRIIPTEVNRANGFRNANRERMKRVVIDGVTYESISDASRSLGIDRRVIVNCLKSGKPSKKYNITVKELDA